MGVSTDRIVYIGTDNGLFALDINGSVGEPRVLGFQGRGSIRHPVARDNDDPQVLYVGTNKVGMQRSRDGGATWQEINDGIIYKEIWSLVQHPATGDLYAGTGPTSVFKSTDRGDTWQDCETLKQLEDSKEWTFPNRPHVSHVKWLTASPDEPDVVLGAIEEGWIVRSQDGGTTWQTCREGMEFDAHSVSVMPDDPKTVLATSGKGVFRSTDRGDTFVEANDGLAHRYLAQIVVHPSRPNLLFTAGAEVPPPFWRRPEGANSGVYRSEDQGKSWTHIVNGLPDYIKAAPRTTAGDPSDPDTLLVGFTDGSLWLSRDGGESFTQAAGGLPPIGGLRILTR